MQRGNCCNDFVKYGCDSYFISPVGCKSIEDCDSCSKLKQIKGVSKNTVNVNLDTFLSRCMFRELSSKHRN